MLLCDKYNSTPCACDDACYDVVFEQDSIDGERWAELFSHSGDVYCKLSCGNTNDMFYALLIWQARLIG